MIDREHIENFLRINQVPATSPDEDIRSVLLAARWHERDVESAILVLRGNAADPELTVSSAHTLLRTDRAVAPETLSALLGIDIVVRRDELRRQHHDLVESEQSHIAPWFSIVAIAIVVALIFGVFSMYVMRIGPFYSPLDQFTF